MACAADLASTRPSDDPTIDAAIEKTKSADVVVHISWSFPKGTVVGCELESKLIGPDEEGNVGNFHLIHVSNSGAQDNYRVAGLLPGRTYKFRIRADFDDGTVSPYISTAITMPAQVGTH
jgi:Fibronectin type III domain